MSTFFTIMKSIFSVAMMLFKYAFYRVISSFLTGLVLLFIAIVMFATFYQAYMPVMSHVKPVYLQFSSECEGQSDSTTLCTYPEASVFFTSSNKANEERMLMRGQAYKVFLDLEMPPSPTNEKLGMFMVNVKFLSSKGTVLKSSSRSCMLHYESSLVRLFRTIFYSLPLTLGISEEKQKVEIKFFDDYIDDSYNPVVQAKVVIMTKQVEIYSSTLRIQASFTGLRYLFFNWPVLFSFLGILGNFITVTLLYSACINQFMPNTNSRTPTSSSVAAQRQNVTNVQRQNAGTSQSNNGRTLTENTTAPVSNDVPPPAVSNTPVSNIEAVSLNGELGGPSQTAQEETRVQKNVPSKSCEIKRHRYTRVAHVKLRLHRKQPKISHTVQRRVKKVNALEKSNDDGIDEFLKSESTAVETGLNIEEVVASDDLTNASVRDSSTGSLLFSGKKSSADRISHVRKRRRTDFENKRKKGETSKTTSSTIVNKKVAISNSQKDKLKQNAHELTENGPGPSDRTKPRPDHDMNSFWENFCFAKSWEHFKLPRIRRLGTYLKETMPSVSPKLKHCVSDLELSTLEEERFNGSDSPKRSVSASDISSLEGTATVMSEIFQ